MTSKYNLRLSFLLVLVIYLGYGFKSKIADSDQYKQIDQQIAINDPDISGEELFLKNCTVCHGNDKQGNPPAFPSLININKKYSKKEISTLLKTGRNIMPNFSHLSDSERSVIIDYLYGENKKTKQITELSPTDKGKNLFIANCARCHEPDAVNSSSDLQMHMGMKPPKLNGINSRVNFNQFTRILNMGPWYMPSFASMENDDKNAIFSYLSSLESDNQYADYNRRRGRRCGMMGR